MSVELLKLTSASLPSANKSAPRICKPAASTLPAKMFDNAIFSPLPTTEAPKEISVQCQKGYVVQEPIPHQPTANNSSFSPITIMASDKFVLSGTPTSFTSTPNGKDTSTESQSGVQSILSSNSSTPKSVRVKILSSKLKEIPSPVSPYSQITRDNKCNSPPGADFRTPPRALGIPTNKKNYENHGGLHLKPNSVKPVKKVLSQGIINTGPTRSVASADESSPDDSIVVVHLNNTEQTVIKDKLCQKKGTSLKHGIVVYPNVLQHKEKALLTKEAKEMQTENFSTRVDEGTQCEEEKVAVRAQGIQTSPRSSDVKKKQYPFQSEPVAITQATTTPQLSDAVTLIASTAAAAAVAASASLHNNDKRTKDTCLTTRIGNHGSRRHLQDVPTITRADVVHSFAQTVETDHRGCLKEPATTNPTMLDASSQTNHSKGNSQINKKAQVIFDHGSVRRDSQWLQRSELLKQKYEKSSIDRVVEVLHSAAVAREEIEHQCAALESTPTLTEFTDAMIEGRPIQERIRIHQSVNKLIEQAKGNKGNWSTPEATPTRKHRNSLEADRGKSLQARHLTKLNQKKRRKAACPIEDYHRHAYMSKLDYGADAENTYPKPDSGIVMNPLLHNIGCQMNSTNQELTAVLLGPPRQSKSRHHRVAPLSKSIGCQAASTPVIPVSKAEEEPYGEKKPDTSTGSVELTSSVNINASNGMTEAMGLLSPAKPSPSAASAEQYDDAPHSNSFQQVLDIHCPSSTNNSDVTIGDKEAQDGMAIIVDGEEVQSAADYQGPSFPPKPTERLFSYNLEPQTMSASELDKKLKENLEQKAMEWIHQELLVRLTAERRQDPVGHMVDSCSTCSNINSPAEDMLGMHKVPEDEENEYIKELVYEELLGLIKKVLKESSCKKEMGSPKESEVSQTDDTSWNGSVLCHLVTPIVTPPPTPTNLRSTTSSPDHGTPVITPLPTPPQSPTPMSMQHSAESCSMELEGKRIATPKSSLSSASNDGIDDSSTHSIQPEVIISNLSSPSTTQSPTLTASVPTPQASSESTTKPQMEEAITKQTIDPTTSPEPSSSTGSSPAVSDAATTSSPTTTDYDISMGEYILAKPPVVQRAKKADYSLSEGEVPLSPGDARWSALHARKLRGNLKEQKKKGSTRPGHPALEAFLDLKQALACEKDSDSATEFSADSLQLKPRLLIGNGEVQERSCDPLKKLLDKLNLSSSSSDSTNGIQDDEKDNTLSEVTSFATQEDSTSIIASPVPAAGTTAVVTDAIDSKSPGEITRNISVSSIPPEGDPSLGEINDSRGSIKMSRSPGEVPPILRATETRHGIDVIRISKWSDNPPSSNDGPPSAVMTSESQYLMEQFDSSDIIHTSTSRSSMNTQGHSNASLQHQPLVGHTSTSNGPTESQVYSSSPTMLHTVEGDVNRKVVTINIPGTTDGGFYSEDHADTSDNQPSTEMSITITTLSSENF